MDIYTNALEVSFSETKWILAAVLLRITNCRVGFFRNSICCAVVPDNENNCGILVNDFRDCQESPRARVLTPTVAIRTALTLPYVRATATAAFTAPLVSNIAIELVEHNPGRQEITQQPVLRTANILVNQSQGQGLSELNHAPRPHFRVYWRCRRRQGGSWSSRSPSSNMFVPVQRWPATGHAVQFANQGRIRRLLCSGCHRRQRKS